jgi:hypothetical protein
MKPLHTAKCRITLHHIQETPLPASLDAPQTPMNKRNKPTLCKLHDATRSHAHQSKYNLEGSFSQEGRRMAGAFAILTAVVRVLQLQQEDLRFRPRSNQM